MAQTKKYLLNYPKAGMHVPAKFEAWQTNVRIPRGTLLEEMEIINPYVIDNSTVIIRCQSVDHADVVVDCSSQDLSELSTFAVKLLLPIIDFDVRLQMFRDPEWLRELCQIDVNTPVEVEFNGMVYPGVVRYCGEVRGMDPLYSTTQNKNRKIGGGIYFGVELVDHRGHGDCDGFKLGKQYFTSDDRSSCFVDASQIHIRHVPMQRSHQRAPSKLTADNAVIMHGTANTFSSSPAASAPPPPAPVKNHNVGRMTALLPSLHLRSKHDRPDGNGKTHHSSITSSIVHALGGGKSKQRSNGTTAASYTPRDYEFDSGIATTASDDYSRGRLSSTSSPGASGGGFIEEPSSLYNSDIVDSGNMHAAYHPRAHPVRAATYAGDNSPPRFHERQIAVAVDSSSNHGSKWSPRILGRRHERAAAVDRMQQQPIQAYAPAAAVAARVGEITPVRLNDRIVWIDEEGRNQYGSVKWIGHMPQIDHDWMVGVEFDNAVGSGTGVFENEQLFKARQNHASFVPVAGLMLAEDFEGNVMQQQNAKSQSAVRNNMPSSSVNSIVTTHSTVSSSSSSRNGNSGIKSSTSNPENMNGISRGSPPRRLYGKADFLPSHNAPKAEPEFFEPLPRLEQLTMTTQKQSSRGNFSMQPQQNNAVNRCDSMTEVADIFFSNEDDRYNEYNNNNMRQIVSDDYVSSSTQNPVVSSSSNNNNIIRRETGEPNGRWKGIQGTRNSCYLDTTLFSMFYFTSVFDNLLYRPQRGGDIGEYAVVQRTLRDEVVRPLREHRFVPHSNVMKLRKLLDSLGQVQGLTSDEKDPEEFIESLLTQTLKADPLLHLSSGETSTMLQLIVDPKRRDERELVPTVQELFDESTKSLNVQFTRIPSCLILMLPRSGSHFKMYRFTIPNLWLDVTEALKCAPTAAITTTTTNLRVRLQLFAVICIRTSHYVAFVRSRVGSSNKESVPTAKDAGNWYFFDSMADREEFPTSVNVNVDDEVDHGCCVPEVKRVWPNNLDTWIGTDEGIRKVRQFLVDNGLVQPSQHRSSDAGEGETDEGRRTPSNSNRRGDDAVYSSDANESSSNNSNMLPADIPNALLSRFLQDAYVCMYEQRVEPSAEEGDKNGWLQQ